MNGSSVFAVYHGCQQFFKTHLTLYPMKKSNNLKPRIFEILVQRFCEAEHDNQNCAHAVQVHFEVLCFSWDFFFF
jgi:hypothetical protein